MIRAVRYAFDEAVASLWRGRHSGVLSTATIAIALFVVGAFWLVTSNLERLGTELGSTAEMSVYLVDDVTPAQRDGVEQALRNAVVVGYEYVSEADALRRFREMFADVAPVSDGLDDNPLPASYEVRLRSDAAGREAVDALAATLRGSSGVSDVRYDREWLDRLLAGIGILRSFGLVLGLILTVAAALTVANVVRLALHARRDEIEIMELVGAPRAYIRGPFVMEGVLQGGIGALVALAVLAAAYLALRGPYLVPLAQTLNMSTVRFLSPQLCVIVLAGGMAVGCVGGLVAAARSGS